MINLQCFGKQSPAPWIALAPVWISTLPAACNVNLTEVPLSRTGANICIRLWMICSTVVWMALHYEHTPSYLLLFYFMHTSLVVFYNICTVHGADLIHISLLVIHLCIVVYVTNKTWNLKQWNAEGICSGAMIVKCIIEPEGEGVVEQIQAH